MLKYVTIALQSAKSMNRALFLVLRNSLQAVLLLARRPGAGRKLGEMAGVDIALSVVPICGARIVIHAAHGCSGTHCG